MYPKMDKWKIKTMMMMMMMTLKQDSMTAEIYLKIMSKTVNFGVKSHV